MKKNIFKIATVCLLTLSVCLSVLCVNARAVDSSAVDSDGDIMYIYFCPVNTAEDKYGNLIPDKSGKVMVMLQINKPNDGVSLTITTRDKSALAAESDYIAQSKDVHLVTGSSASSSSVTEYFTVQTCRSGAANLISASNNSYYGDSGLTRVFEILICNIKTDSGCDYVVSNEVGKKEKGSLSIDSRVQTTYDYEYSEKSGKNGLYFTDYLYGKSFVSKWFDRDKIYSQTPSGSICISVDNDTNYEYNASFDRFISYDYILKYYNTGWADVYYGGSATISESSWSITDTPAILQLIGEGGMTVFYSEYYDPKSSGAPILFGDTGYSNNSDDYRYYLTDKAKKWLNNTSSYTVINTDDPMYSHAYCYYTRKNYNFPSVTGKVFRNNSEKLNLKITRDSTYKMNFEYLRIDSELYDTTSPVITKTSLSDVTTTDNKTLRLSVRFSEPVHFPTDSDKKDLIVTGYADNKITMPLEFLYAGGEGTDTLYFDCNLDDEKYTGSSLTNANIQNITFGADAFDKCRDISDYAYNFNLNNNFVNLTSFNGAKFSVNIDMRQPSVSSKISGTASAAQTHEVAISVGNTASESAKLYYTWVKKTSDISDPDNYSPAKYDYCITSPSASVTVKGEKLDGEYYLYYMAVSSYGMKTVGHTERTMIFDNTPFEVSSVSMGDPNSTLSERDVTLTLKGNATGGDLVQILMKYRMVGETEWNRKVIYSTEETIRGEDTISALTYSEENDRTTAQFTLNGSTFGMEKDQSKVLYFQFITLDKANNTSEYIVDEAYRFDTSDRCNVNLDINGTPYTFSETSDVDNGTTINKNEKSYQNSYFAKDFKLSFKIIDPGSDIDIDIASLYKYGEGDVTAKKEDYFTCSHDSVNKTYTMEYNADSGGYFSIQMQTGTGDKKSQVFSFFIAGTEDNVDGYNTTVTDRLVINKVWVVNDISYYRMSANNTVIKENYNTTKKLSLAFSSEDIALRYYTFMEMQDVSLYYTTESTANALNGGYNETFKKAPNEKKAEANETWIRYKSPSWDQTSESKYWNYYYYSSAKETEINTSRFSDNLTSAINSVVTKIMNKGGYVYLASDDELDACGVPQLDSSRIRPNSETVAETKTGTKFTSPLTFAGDNGIYSSTKKTDDGEYPIAVQQLNVTDYTTFFYKKHGGGDYVKLNVSGSFRLKDEIHGTGVYDIIERSEKGIRTYSVYIDNNSPEINVLYNQNDEEGMTITKKEAEEISILNVKSFSFVSLVDNEDAYAYVALFTYGGVYKGAYLASELAGLSLADGKYIVKVYDRSGNGFQFPLRISTEDLQSSCSIRNVPNEYLQFTCTYSKDDIYRFEIYLDNVLITDSVDSLSFNKKMLYDGGKYRFYIEDIFGNVYEKEEELVRVEPEVTWYYEQDGSFVKFDEEATDSVGFVKTKIGSSSYSITTNGSLRFRYPVGDYEYEFLAGSGTLRYFGNYSEVVINETDNWQVKVYYKKYPDLFVNFVGKTDSSAPTISLVTNRVKYSYADESEDVIRNYFLTHKNVKVGDIINLSDVSFKQTDMVTETVGEGELVTGSLVTLRLSDSSGIYKWSCTYNGVVTEYVGELADKMVFSKEGGYVITATDKIGNTSTYSFSIGRSEFTELGVDDLDGIVSESGHKNVIAKITGAGEFVFIVNGEYFKLTTNGTYLKRITLKVAAENGSYYAKEEEKTLTETLTSTPIIVSEYGSFYIRAFVKDGAVCLETALTERKENEIHKINVQFCVRSDETVECKYAEVELSDELSYLNYIIGKDKSVLKETLYVSDEVTLSCTDDITWFCLRYSATDNFDSSEYDFLFEDYVCEKTGFYEIVAYNKYGNSSTVKVIYHKGILLVGTVGYADGESLIYSVNYDGAYYSNDFVSFRIYNDAKYSVKKDGKNYTPDIGYNDGVTIVTIKEIGDYELYLNDKFGNEATKKIGIHREDIGYSDGWLDGFNENALKKSEGYTNSKVNFVKSELLNGEVKSITIITPDGKTVVVYDDVSEERIAFDDNYVIGDDGDGEYRILFRNIYGDRADKSVHYRSQSTLIATRVTRNMEKESYTVDDKIVESGVWSNKTINLVSEASKSVFTVNSEERNLPFSLEFPSESISGRYDYVIEYIDEYGFSFKFSCILYRTTINVEPYEMSVSDGVTKDPVAVTFDDGYTAKICLNGEDLGEYKSGTKYLQDGSYIITVTDIAGNVTNYSVKRDSTAEFCFYVGTLDQKLTSGEVTNESVRFAPLNGDAVSYYSVCLNGKEVDGYDSSLFNESGKWEIVLKDEIGNKDYFCFYIITHSLLHFAYTTPQGFKIVEVTYNAGGGKVDWIDAVEDKGDSSYLDFEESGEYEVVMMSYLTNKTSKFSIVIDKSVPKIVLNGVENGGVTTQNVTVSGYKEGDTVYIYKDGVLIEEIKIVTLSDVSEIKEKGKYKIVVVNEAGGSSEVEFTRVYTANIATSVLIIVIILAVVAGLFAGLLFRKRARIE